MKRISFAVAALLFAAAPTLADDKPTADEQTKINSVLSAWGCSGGESEKESEASGLFEVDDAKCKDGANYDFRISPQGKVIMIVAD